MGQGQSGPRILKAEPVLVLPGLTLTKAMAHAEDECGLLLVNLRGGTGEVGSWATGGDSPPLLPSGALALTENQSTLLRLSWEWEGPHCRRAVLPTSTSTSSGSGSSASPSTPGARGHPAAASAPAAPHPSSHPAPAAVLPATFRV